MISGLLREISFCRHHVEPRVKLYMPREESYPIPLNYIDFARTTHTSLDVMMEKHIDDYWNVDGERELSDAWTGFTRFILLNERPPDGFSCSGSRLTRKQTTSRPDDVWQDMWKQMSDASKRKAKQKWAIEKPKLDNARKLRGLFFIEPNDEFFFLKKWKPPGESWKFPCQQQCLAKYRYWIVEKPTATLGKTRPTMLVLSMPTNLWEYDWKVCRTGITKITSLQKEYIHEDHYNLVQKFIPMPEALKINGSEGCSGKRMGKTWETTGMAADESQKQERGDRGSKE